MTLLEGRRGRARRAGLLFCISVSGDGYEIRTDLFDLSVRQQVIPAGHPALFQRAAAHDRLKGRGVADDSGATQIGHWCPRSVGMASAAVAAEQRAASVDIR